MTEGSNGVFGDARWLEAVPRHWTIAPVYARCEVQLGKMLDGKRIVGDRLAPYLRNVDVQWGKINTGDLPQMDFSEADRQRFALRAGDLLVCEGGEIGRCAVWPGNVDECYYQKALLRVRPHGDGDRTDFLYYAMYAAAHQGVFDARADLSTIAHLPAEKLRRYRLPFPTADEQRAIVGFLDRETARIDALIEKKRRQIELLDEKRAALISHAVTKGLDPAAPMKDSGIDWLGQVSAQWQHRKLGYLVTMEGGCTPSKSNPEYWIGDIPWVSPKDMKTRVVSESEDHVSEDAVRESSLRLLDPPVVLMVVRGMILAHTFPVALTAVPVTINQDMKALQPKPSCSALYLAYLLEGISSLILSLVEESAHGTKCLRTEIWKGINLFLPSPAEQAGICEELDRHNERLSLLVDRISLSIDRLREYRTALISAAVTGKIDVRQEVA